MRSPTSVPYLVRGAIAALLFMIAAGLLFGPASRPEPRSAEAALLSEVRKPLTSDSEAGAYFGTSGAVRDAGGPPKVRPEVSAVLQARAEVSVIVSLREPPALRARTINIGILEAQVAESQQRVLSVLARNEFKTLRQYQAVPALAGIATATAIDKLAAHPEVMAVTLNREVRVGLSESVPLINADDVHGLGYTGQGVVVAVLDTGLDTDHVDLSDDLLAEICFLTDPDVCPPAPHPAEDGHGHGTNVTGIITGAGIVAPLGVAPDADIIAYKVMGDDGTGWFSDVLAAADDIIANHPEVDIINMSIGDGGAHVPGGACDSLDPALATAFATLTSNDVMIIAASGNEGYKSWPASAPQGFNFPACMSDVVSVGAVFDGGTANAADEVPTFSNSHPDLDLLAPGSPITATGLAGGVQTYSGTSQASPHAAAVAALVRQVAPSMSSASIG